MASDAEFVGTIMMSQSILQPVDTVKEGENDNASRKRALSGEVDSEAPKKPRQVYSTDGSSDLLELMKAQFTSFRADLKDMRNEMSATLDSKFISFEAKLTGTVMKVVHEEIDSVKKNFNSRIDGLSSKLESKLMKFVETHVDDRVKDVRECIKTEIGITDLQKDVSSLKKSYADAAISGVSRGASPSSMSSSDGIELNIIIRNMNCDPSEHTDNNVTVNKVNLFRDGLKLRNVKVTSCERK